MIKRKFVKRYSLHRHIDPALDYEDQQRVFHDSIADNENISATVFLVDESQTGQQSAQTKNRFYDKVFCKIFETKALGYQEERKKMKKSPPRLGLAVFLLVSLLISCFCSGCFLIAREPSEPPTYLFQEAWNEFESKLSADPSIAEYNLKVGDSVHDEGLVYLNISVSADDWEKKDEIFRETILPFVSRKDILLYLDDRVYQDTRKRMWYMMQFTVVMNVGELDVSTYYTAEFEDGFMSWVGPGDNNAFGRISTIPSVALSDSIPESLRGINARYLLENDNIEWVYMDSGMVRGSDDPTLFFDSAVIVIQLSDRSWTYTEIEDLFRNYLTVINPDVLDPMILDAQKRMGRYDNLESLMLVFGVDGPDGGAIFEASVKDDFKEWIVVQASVDPLAEGKTYNHTD